MRGVLDIFDVLYKLMPQWMVFTLFFILLLALFPFWFRWVRNKQIKGRIRTFASTTDVAKKSRVQEALWHHIGSHPKRLTTAALAAFDMGAVSLQKEAERRLITLGHPLPPYPIKEGRPDGPGRLHPLEVQVRVSQLLDQDLPEAARELVEDALLRHRENADLLSALQAIDDFQSTSATIPPPLPSTPHDA